MNFFFFVFFDIVNLPLRPRNTANSFLEKNIKKGIHTIHEITRNTKRAWCSVTFNVGFVLILQSQD